MQQNFTVVVQWILYVIYICIILKDIISFQSKLLQENELFRNSIAPCYGPEDCGIQVYVIAMPGRSGHYSNVATGWTYEELFSIPNRE